METTYDKTCPVCGAAFTANRKNAKTCSQRCRNALSVARKIVGNTQAEDQPDVITPANGLPPAPDVTDEQFQKAKEYMPIYYKLFHKEYQPKKTKQ